MALHLEMCGGHAVCIPPPNTLPIFSSNFDSSGIEDVHYCDTKKRYGTGGLFKSQDDSHLDVTILGPGDWVSTIPFCPLRYRYQLCYKFGIALTTDDPS